MRSLPHTVGDLLQGPYGNLPRKALLRLASLPHGLMRWGLICEPSVHSIHIPEVSMSSQQQQHGLTVLRRPQVQRRTGLARSSMYALIASGQFPSPIHLTPHTVGWLEHEIDSWIQERTHASRVTK